MCGIEVLTIIWPDHHCTVIKTQPHDPFPTPPHTHTHKHTHILVQWEISHHPFLSWLCCRTRRRHSNLQWVWRHSHLDCTLLFSQCVLIDHETMETQKRAERRALETETHTWGKKHVDKGRKKRESPPFSWVNLDLLNHSLKSFCQLLYKLKETFVTFGKWLKFCQRTLWNEIWFLMKCNNNNFIPFFFVYAPNSSKQ